MCLFRKIDLRAKEGGISTSYKTSLKPYVSKVAEDNNGDEFMITRVDHVIPALNIVHIYGQQESRVSRGKLIESWEKIKEELVLIKERNEAALIVGDLNRDIGNDEYGVIGNHDNISYGGKLVRELIKTGEYIMVNNMNIAKGGP